MKGIYILIIKLSKDAKIKIGKLGIINFSKGTYAYIGSAQNNLEKRINRHLKPGDKKKMHWHIDYFLKDKNAKIVKVLYKKATKVDECKTARRFKEKFKQIENFGCSDCKCNSHLFKIK